MKMERKLCRCFFCFGSAVILISAIATKSLSAQEAKSAVKAIKPDEEIITRLFGKLAELLGSEAAALVVLVLVSGVIGYLVKDAIPVFCKWLVSSTLGFFNNLRGRNLGAYRRSVISRCEQIRVGYKNFAIDVARDYVSLQIKTGSSDQDVELREVDPILRDFQRLVVRGHPGCGKTTLLKYLAIRYARKSMKAVHGKHLIPVFVSLKDVPVEGDTPSEKLFKYMAERFEPYFKKPEEYFRKQLQSGNCIAEVSPFFFHPPDPIGSGRASSWHIK